jgi:ribosomal protein L3
VRGAGFRGLRRRWTIRSGKKRDESVQRALGIINAENPGKGVALVNEYTFLGAV